MALVADGISGGGREWWMERTQERRAIRVLQKVLWRRRWVNMLWWGEGVSCVVRFAVSQLKSPMLQIRVRRSPDVQWSHTCKNLGLVDLSEGKFFFK